MQKNVGTNSALTKIQSDTTSVETIIILQSYEIDAIFMRLMFTHKKH